MDYLGNKVGFASDLVRLIGGSVSPGAKIADVFAGTGSVSLAFARSGFDVAASDHLPLSVVWTRARLLGGASSFSGLKPELGTLGSDPLATVIGHLDALPGVEGWVTRNYSPASLGFVDVERRYLTEANARRVDAVRLRLRDWRADLTEAEHAVLLTCLLEAVSAVSNIAGTYGCYLKNWKPSAIRHMVLRPYTDFAVSGDHSVACGDAEQVSCETNADAIYADPPYTKRQYAAYYHLLNSIAADEESELTGSTGLPDWRPLASDWCYTGRAPRALEVLAAKSSAPVLALSYSSDGHIPDELIRDILGTHGTVDVHEFERRRYRSSTRPHKGATVMEKLYVMQR